MPFHKITRVIIIIAVLLVNIGCDQLSKNIVRQKIGYNEEISLMNDHLTIMKVENPGAFLSLGDSFPPVIRFIGLGILPVLHWC